MILSDIFFDNVTNKLKLKISSVKNEKFYVKNLLNQIISLKKLKYFNNSTNRETMIYNVFFDNLQNCTISYIINISFLKANTIINISDIKGNLILFYSAGSVKLVGKQKKRRRIAVSKLISLVLNKISFIGKKPIALHLKNVNFYKTLIIGKLKQFLYLRLIKIINQTPYNGCRKRKLRRKKHTKLFR